MMLDTSCNLVQSSFLLLHLLALVYLMGGG